MLTPRMGTNQPPTERPPRGHRSAPRAACGHWSSCGFDTCSKKHSNNRSAVKTDRCAGGGKTGPREPPHSCVVRRGSGRSQLISFAVFTAQVGPLTSAEGALDAPQRLAGTQSIVSMPTRHMTTQTSDRKYTPAPAVTACGHITSAGGPIRYCISARRQSNSLSLSIYRAPPWRHPSAFKVVQSMVWEYLGRELFLVRSTKCDAAEG